MSKATFTTEIASTTTVIVLLTKCNGGEVVELFCWQTATSVMDEEAVKQSSYVWPRNFVPVDKWLPILYSHRCTTEWHKKWNRSKDEQHGTFAMFSLQKQVAADFHW